MRTMATPCAGATCNLDTLLQLTTAHHGMPPVHASAGQQQQSRLTNAMTHQQQGSTVCFNSETNPFPNILQRTTYLVQLNGSEAAPHMGTHIHAGTHALAPFL